MRKAGFPDAFVIINGPQDGTEFPIVEREVLIGSSSQCTVNVVLDRNVLPEHGIATAMAGGYCIRSTSASEIEVNGQRAGRLKSRMIRPGEILRVGYTELQLECSADGMARRSAGVKMPGDLVWFLKDCGRVLAKVGRRIAWMSRGFLRLVWAHKIVTVITLVAAYFIVPGFDSTIHAAWAWLRNLKR